MVSNRRCAQHRNRARRGPRKDAREPHHLETPRRRPRPPYDQAPGNHDSPQRHREERGQQRDELERSLQRELRAEEEAKQHLDHEGSAGQDECATSQDCFGDPPVRVPERIHRSTDRVDGEHVQSDPPAECTDGGDVHGSRLRSLGRARAEGWRRDRADHVDGAAAPLELRGSIGFDGGRRLKTSRGRESLGDRADGSADRCAVDRRIGRIGVEQICCPREQRR